MSNNMEWVKQLLQNRNSEFIKREISRIESPKLLHNIALNYNWDNGFELPNLIVRNSHCDLGTALMLFYNADGYVILDKQNKYLVDGQKDWITFINMLFNKLLNNEFRSIKVSYQPELSKVQKYKLKKANPNIPEMFFEGIRGKE